jgi:hypothetical protein
MNSKFWKKLLIEVIFIFGVPLGINEGLKQFGYDLIKTLHLDLGHYLLCLIIYGLIKLRNIPIQNSPPKNDFAQAILTYLTYLKRSSKHRLVVELRNKLSHLFHIQHLQSEREQLGLIAFESVVALKDQLLEVEIRIDDLGWALHQQKRTVDAKSNIDIGLDLLNKFSPKSNEENLRCESLKAKAYRHLAFIANTEKEANSNLSKCEAIVTALLADATLMQNFEIQIKSNKAQLLHAQATLKVKQTGYHIRGSLVSPNDHQTVSIINLAISELKEAIEISKNISDSERVIKFLIHYEDFLLALGDKANALKARAEIQYYLSESGFDSSMEESVIAQFKLA